MSFWVLPPEVNSARLYAGPGSTPLHGAATAWDTLSQTLYGTANSVLAAVGSIPWTGPSATAMRAAFTRYTTWLTTTAAQAETTAQQARTAAAAFETVRASAVHPAAVAANRTQTVALLATNLLGQNTPTIAALEAQYAQMWAQDVAAMADYLATTTAATSGLQPFNAIAGQLADPTTVLGQLNEYGIALASSGPYQVPLQLLGLFTVLWGVTTPASVFNHAIGDITANAQAITPQIPAPQARATASVRAAMGTTQKPAGLSAPPSWARPPLQAPPREPTVRPLPPEETDVPIPLPLPLMRGTPMKQDRPVPEYGQQTVRFIPNAPI